MRSVRHPRPAACGPFEPGSLAVREHELRASSVPILVVVGENDPVRTDVSRLRGVLDDLDVVVVPETDHFSAVSHPQFLQAILQFIGSQ